MENTIKQLASSGNLFIRVKQYKDAQECFRLIYNIMSMSINGEIPAVLRAEINALINKGD